MNEESNIHDGFAGHDCAAGLGGAGYSPLPQNAVYVMAGIGVR
jgi:hypothetical protein